MNRSVLSTKAVPLFALTLCAVAAFGLACAKQEASTTTGATSTSSMTTADSIELGRRMTMVGACNDCHTPGTFYGSADTTRRLSGSELGWTGPWGTSYPRNITPDVETGIGSWSAHDIVVAIREGHRPDGSPLLPPMPWPMYASFNDLEAYSIAVYLKSIPAVKHEVPKVDPPGKPASRPAFLVPAPPAWDAPKTPPAGEGTAPPAG
jgi:hypothetical protein